MIKIQLLICTVFISFRLSASILTLSNEAYLPAQYSNAQAAHDAANNGDTLLVSSTGMSYGDLTISKELSVIGSNFVPGLSAQFATIYFANENSSGTLLQSLQIGSVQIPSGLTSTDFNDITIRRCNLYSIYMPTDLGVTANHCYNWLIEGCAFIGTGGLWNMNTSNGYSRFENFTIRNNVFNGTLLDLKYCSIKNNIFLGTNPNESCVNGMEYCTFSNNIVYGRSNTGGQNTAFNNNVVFGGTDNVFTIPGLGNTAIQNTADDPLFVNVIPNNNFNFNFDYHLQSGSPAIGAGDNGLDCGVYDGSEIFRMDGEPDIPLVRSVTLPDGNTVPAQGSFQITVISVSHP